MSVEDERTLNTVKDAFEAFDINGESGEFAIENDADFQDLLGAAALYFGVADRPTVDECWKGAGLYRVRLAEDPSVFGLPWREREAARSLEVELVKNLEKVDFTTMPF